MKIVTSCAVLALLLAAPAGLSIAQTATTTTNTDSQTQPLPTIQAKPADQSATQSADKSAQKPLDGQIMTQDKDTFLASIVLGSKVYSTDNQKVGSVNDFIAKPDGKMVGVVIGV